MGKSSTVVIDRASAELAFRALDDAKTEIEAFEMDAKWYTASQKMMDRIDNAMKALHEILHTSG